MSDQGLESVCQIWSSNQENVRKSNQEPTPRPPPQKKVSDTRGSAKTRELIYDKLYGFFFLAFLSNLSIEMKQAYF